MADFVFLSTYNQLQLPPTLNCNKPSSSVLSALILVFMVKQLCPKACAANTILVHASSTCCLVIAGPKDILIADSLCQLGSPIASNTKLPATFELQAEPELTRIFAASNKSIISLELNPGIEKLMVVGTELSKL